MTHRVPIAAAVGAMPRVQRRVHVGDEVDPHGERACAFASGRWRSRTRAAWGSIAAIAQRPPRQ